MEIIDKIKNILNSLEDIKTVMYESAFGANLRVDRKEAPFAIMYTVADYQLDMSRNLKEGCNIEIFFAERGKLGDTGDNDQVIIDRTMGYARQFLAVLRQEKSIVIENDPVTVKSAYGRYDAHLVGVSVELQLRDRQAHCIDYEEPSIKTLTVTENGEYDTTQYGRVIVQVGEPPVPPVPPTPVVDRNYLCFTNVDETENTITLGKQGSPATITCEYTLDGETWVVMNVNPDNNGICDTIVLQPNQNVWLKGTGWWEVNTSSNYAQYYLQSTGIIDVSGNPFSICSKDDFDTMTYVPNLGSIRCFVHYIDSQSRSFLKVRNAYFTFDNIESVPKGTSSYSNDGALYCMLGIGVGTETTPNTYIQRIKLGFKRGVSIDMGTTYYRSPLGGIGNNCTSLKEVWLPEWSGVSDWMQHKFLYGTTEGGTLYVPQGKNVTVSDIVGCPTNWSIVYYNPETGDIIQ